MKVFINPGHSPNGIPDCGAVNRELGLRECDVAYDISGLIKKYLETGKSYRFPMTSEKEATMSLSLTEAEEVTKATNKITEVAPGKYESVPTGKTVKTSAHTRMVAKNAVPGWLKQDVTK